MKTILVTGFDPFGGEPINPAWEAVKELNGYESNGYTVVTKMIPTVRYDSVNTVREAIREYNPEAILLVGQAGGRPDITVERVAINVDDFRIPDNKGNQPKDEIIVEGGNPAYFATLPIKHMVSGLQHAGIPASISNTAGTFVCNHIFYGVAHEVHDKGIRCGFVHIPYLPSQVVTKPGQPSMSKEVVIQGLQCMVDTIATGKEYEVILPKDYVKPHD